MFQQLRKLFEGNGASEHPSLPPVAPNQTEATIFISKAMRLVPYRDRLDLSLLQKKTSAASQSPM